jgi:hypothetical protein
MMGRPMIANKSKGTTIPAIAPPESPSLVDSAEVPGVLMVDWKGWSISVVQLDAHDQFLTDGFLASR